MPSVKNVSPATGLPVPEYYIHTTNASFVDTKGRTLLLRGVNLSGSTKAPVGQGTQDQEGFWDTAEAGGTSFVNHPLNLDDGSADVHLARLRGWGFNMLRYVVTWEALEHQGPGKFDYEYMDYTVRVLRRCKAFGFRVFMDPHQDLFSRFSGGSGAPFWTLAACGLEPRNFTKTQATLLHCEYPNPAEADPANFPAMIWSTNYDRLASFTLFTMFFGGRDFAPKCTIDGMNIQDYLLSHYVQAFGLLADRIRDAGDLFDSCVIGWDSMNEPSAGFIGHHNLNDFLSDQAMKKGTRPTPAQALRLGMGMAQTVQVWGFNAFGPKLEGSTTVDPEGTRAWMDPADEPNGKSIRWGWTRGKEWKMGTCPWALHDVWDPESGYMLIPDYFKCAPLTPSKPLEFIEDYWRPYWRVYSERILQSHPEAIHFIQPPVFVRPPMLNEDELRGRACYSPHYYDGLTLITRHWNWFNADALGVLRGKYASPVLAVKFGEWAIRKSLQDQLGEYLKDVKETFGDYPTLIGEIGTPFNMDEKRSYDGPRKGDYTEQQKALDASMNAGDGTNCLNWTIWTYCTDNNHEWGENWNLEDLSLWSADDMDGMEMSRAGSYRMGSTNSSGSRRGQAINPRSDTQLLLTRASSVNLDRLEVPDRSDSYPQFPTAATSLASLNTLPEPDDPSMARTLTFASLPDPHSDAQSVISDSPPITGAEAETLYRFLTNGARAVGAFARPWPIAVVGVPKDIQFNIGRAEFKLVVKVTADDIQRSIISSSPPSPGSSRRRHTSSSDESEKEEFAATEIYIPLIHFAADPFARRAPTSVYSTGSSTGGGDARPSDVSTAPLRQYTSTPTPSSPPRLPEQPQFANLSLGSPVPQGKTTAMESQASRALSSSSRTIPVPPTSSFSSSAPTQTQSEDLSAQGRGDSLSPAWTTWSGYEVPLALEIEASEGSRWEVDGQVLRWWYPGPVARRTIHGEVTAEGEKTAIDGSVERFIRIKRKGGAIKGIGTREIKVEEPKSMWDMCPWS